MKNLKFALVLGVFSALSAHATESCELDNRIPSHVDTWFTLFRTQVIQTAFPSSSGIQLENTVLGRMDDYALLEYASTFHALQVAYGSKMTFDKTYDVLRDSVRENQTICELANRLEENERL